MKTTPEYKRLRSLGYAPKDALRCARIRAQFEALVEQDLARFRTEPDDDWSTPLDMDGTPEDLAAVKARMDQEGVWGIVVDVRCTCCGNWDQVDSCWGFVGEDWRDSGYDVDLMAAAIATAERKVA